MCLASVLLSRSAGISAAAKDKASAIQSKPSVLEVYHPVVSLTNNSFGEHILRNDLTLIEFISPTCGHCKDLQPAFEAAASRMGAEGVPFAKVDATREKELSKKYNIEQYPTLLWFESGMKTEECGKRAVDEIITWVSTRLGRAVIETDSPAMPRNALPRVVLYAGTMLPSFEAAAKSNRRKASWYFVKGAPGVAAATRIELQHINESPVILDESSTLDRSAIDALLDKHRLPLYGRIDQESMGRYSGCGKGLVWCFFPVNDTAGSDVLEAHSRTQMIEFARGIRDKYVVAFMDMAAHYNDAIRLFGITELPSMVVQKKAGDKFFYIYNGEMSQMKMKKFIGSIDSGKQKATVKSQPIPKTNAGPVRVVVGHTVSKEVFTPDKDVLLVVCSSAKEKCRELEREYTKVGNTIRRLGLRGLIKIAMMDGAMNDSPDERIDWEGFPAIFLAKAGMSEPMLFEGELDAKSLFEFIRKEGANIYEVEEILAEQGGNVEL